MTDPKENYLKQMRKKPIKELRETAKKYSLKSDGLDKDKLSRMILDYLIEKYSCEHKIYFPSFKTVDEIEVYMRDYLLGKHHDSPTHLRPLHGETTPMIKKLVKLTKYGLIPTNSQPGIIDGQYKQRFYLDFIVHKNKFIPDILEDYIATENSELIVTSADYKLEPAWSSLISVTYDSTAIFTRAIAMGYGLEFTARACSKPLSDELRESYHVVNIIDPVWGREMYGLDFLLKFMKNRKQIKKRQIENTYNVYKSPTIEEIFAKVKK